MNIILMGQLLMIWMTQEDNTYIYYVTYDKYFLFVYLHLLSYTILCTAHTAYHFL